MENQAFHKKGHGMAWDQNALRPLTLADMPEPSQIWQV